MVMIMPSKNEFYKIVAKQNKVTVYLFGEIGWDVNAEEFVSELGGYGQSVDVDVYIGSGGGSVWQGLDIYNALASTSGTVTAYVTSIAASMASVAAMAADKIYMYDTSMMMIHKPHGGSYGNASDHRENADLLDAAEANMVKAYTKKTGKTTEEVEAMIAGADYWMTAEMAVDLGFADEVIEGIDEDMPMAASLSDDVIASCPEDLKDRLNACLAKNQTKELSDEPVAVVEVALSEEIKSAINEAKADIIADDKESLTGDTPLAVASINQSKDEEKAMPDDINATPAVEVDVDKMTADIQANVDAQAVKRVDDIRAVFASHEDHKDLMVECITDPKCSKEDAKDKLLAAVSVKPATPLAHVEVVADESDRFIEAASDAILLRAGIKSVDGKAIQGNELSGLTAMEMLKHNLKLRGMSVGGMNSVKIAGAGLSQSTSDFPILLENVLHKTLMNAYRIQTDRWTQFCKVGSVSDFKPHHRYRSGSIGNLLALNELGEYQNITIPDGEKESLTATTKGGIINISRETLINDDLGAMVDLSANLGRAAKRSIETSVFTLLASNPTMSDGVALFHATHGNLGTGGVPSTTTFGEASRLMGSQTDISGNDILDISPAIFLGGNAAGATAKEVNAAEYNTDIGGGNTSKNNRVPNTSRGMFDNIVETARITGTEWYAFASTGDSPVIEVAFLNGEQDPYIEMQNSFDQDGIRMKVRHDWAAGAIDWRGAVKNAGA
jgi:ATP-dependent Clp endopeptidase proteolytic subunit ClpP